MRCLQLLWVETIQPLKELVEARILEIEEILEIIAKAHIPQSRRELSTQLAERLLLDLLLAFLVPAAGLDGLADKFELVRKISQPGRKLEMMARVLVHKSLDTLD